MHKSVYFKNGSKLNATMLQSTWNYFPFGSTINTRAFSSGAYRYGFNGKELDKNEEGMGGGGSIYDYGFRIYNPNLGKFLSVDPLFESFPWYTPYQFAGNNTIASIDLDGLEQYHVTKNYTQTSDGITIKAEIEFRVETNRKVASSGVTDKNRLGTILYMCKLFKFSIFHNVNSFSSFSWEYSMSNRTDIIYYETEQDALSQTNAKTGSLKDSHNKWIRNDDGTVGNKTTWTNTWSLKNSTILHNTNQVGAKFSDDDKKKLDEVANALLANPLITVDIESYTSNKGSNHEALAQKRADKMKDEIVNIAKVKVQLILRFYL